MNNLFIKYLRIPHISRNYLVKSNVSLSFLSQILISATSFASNILLARILGLQEFGIFSLLVLVQLFVSSLQSSLILIPKLSILQKFDIERKRIYQNGSLGIQLIFLFFSVLGCYLFLRFGVHLLGITNLDKITVYSLLVFLTIVQMYDFTKKHLIANKDVLSALHLDILRSILQISSLFFLAFYNNLSIQTVFWAYSIPMLFSILIKSRREYSMPSIYSIKLAFSNNWGTSKHLTVSTILQWLSGNLFVIYTGVSLGASSVGALKAVQSISSIANIGFETLNSWIPVKASSEYVKGGINKLKKLINSLIKKMLFMITLITSIIAINSKQLLTIFFGTEYAEYWWLLVAYCLAIVLLSFNSCVRFALLPTEKSKYITFAFMASSLFSISAAPFLISNFQLKGVAIGIIITQLLSFMVYITAYWRLFYRTA